MEILPLPLTPPPDVGTSALVDAELLAEVAEDALRAAAVLIAAAGRLASGKEEIVSYPGTGKKPQQITRLPEYRPGTWVKLRSWQSSEEQSCPRLPALDSLSGKVRRVKSLTCIISSPEQKHAVWRAILEPCGRAVEVHRIERFATAEEIAAAEQSLNGRAGAANTGSLG